MSVEMSYKPFSNGYETTLGYLEYDETNDRVSLPIRIRERHLTPDAREAHLQGIGPAFQITVWSKRDTILIHLPVLQWLTTKPYEGTFTGTNNGLLSVGRFEDSLANDENEIEAVIQPVRHEQLLHGRGETDLR